MPSIVAKSVGLIAVCAMAVGLGQCAKPEPMVDYVYDVMVTLTPAAEAKLKAANDSLVVNGHYYGLATAASRDRANTVGQIPLTDARTGFGIGDHKVHVTISFKTSDLTDVSNHLPYVSLSVFSLLPSGTPDERLECTTYRGPLTTIQAVPVTIACDAAQ